MAFEEKWIRWMTDPQPGLGVRGARAVAWGASLVYGGVMRVRNLGYERGWLRSYSLGRPVISVGNLSTGGTGKTPVVAWVVKELQGMGKKPAVLLRGYRGVEVEGVMRSDEQMELEGMLPGVAVVANSDRVVAAGTVLKADPSVEVFVLDDAFQHRRVRRDLDVVLVSATQPPPGVGGYVLPRGFFREPIKGLKRADVVVMTRVDQAGADTAAGVYSGIREIVRQVPVAGCRHAVVEMELVHGVSARELRAEGVVAVCALGEPGAFHRTLEEQVGAGFAVRSYPDHHAYSAEDVAEIGAMGKAVVTTGKDWVKLAPLVGGMRVPVYVVRVAVRFEGEGGEVLRGKLGSLF